MEGGEAEQGAGPPYTSKVARLDRGPGHPTSLKQEVKPEPETVDSKQWFKQEFVKEEVGGAGYSGHQHGEQLAGGQGGQDTFLLTNSPLPEQQLGPAPAPAPAPDQGRDKQKTNTAAKIRVALEASGLAGNLTPEDLQTLKRLNEIAKSTGLSQEQKSSEASQLLKNNPNVSRLLLKLRTGKSVGPKGGQEGGGAQYPAPAQQFPRGQSPGLGPQLGRAGSPATGQLPPSYGSTYGQNNNNYYSAPGGQGGQQWGGPGSPGPGYYRPELHQHQHQPGYPPQQQGFSRGGGGGGLYPGQPMMDSRVHGHMLGPGGAPRTMYVRRADGMLMQPDYPGPAPGMMAGRGGGGFPGPGYMGPGGYPHPGTGMLGPGRRMVTPGAMLPHPHQQQQQQQYPDMAQQQRQPPATAAPLYPAQPAPALAPDYGESFPGPGGSFRDFRENLLTSKFPGAEFSPGTRQPPPPHTTGGSQLRARLSQQPGAGAGAGSGGGELASRLLHGPAPPHQPPSYEQYGGQQQQQQHGNFQNGNNQLKMGSEALFDEIDNSQFDYFNSLDTGESQSSAPSYGLEAGEAGPGEPAAGYDSWKVSGGTAEVRNTMLRKLATAIEANQHISAGEAARVAADIETRAYTAAGGESDYQSRIVQHLAQVDTIIILLIFQILRIVFLTFVKFRKSRFNFYPL